MATQNNKLKILYLMDILLRKTDEKHTRFWENVQPPDQCWDVPIKATAQSLI